jgi:Icc-related predicted phosphoesterase
VSLTLYYASDIHGSDRLWRKFVNAGAFYRADVLVMGGDIAGKAVIPIVRRNGGFTAREIVGDRIFGRNELPAVEKRIRDLGFYPLQTSEEEVESAHGDRDAIDALFRRAMAESLERWLALAEERLRGTETRLHVMLGNDDEPHLKEVLAASPLGVDCEDVTVQLGEGFELLSCGYANPTPWHSPREIAEDELERHIEGLVANLADPHRAVFNLHVPPLGTPLDRAPQLDETLKPVVSGGAVVMASVGSRAVRDVIERHQPPLALHGHIHESRGVAKLGRTVCINPGSEYAEGVLHGAIAVLDRKKGLRNYQLVSG